jgi:hypothetical protein
MQKQDYISYSNRINNSPVDPKDKKPFIAGGYTQADWNILCGYLFDQEFFDDYMNTPEARAKYIEQWTKPVWA